jgi:hypothetical protein
MELRETNESLKAIVGSIGARKNSNVLVICGSGDVPFALAGKGCNVTAVDVRKEQIQYAQEIQEKIHKGRFLEYLFPEGFEHFRDLALILSRAEYFASYMSIKGCNNGRPHRPRSIKNNQIPNEVRDGKPITYCVDIGSIVLEAYRGKHPDISFDFSKTRLQKVRERGDTIRYQVANIEQALQEAEDGSLGAVYLSNAIRYASCNNERFQIEPEIFGLLAKKLNRDGIIYATLERPCNLLLDQAIEEGIVTNGTFEKDEIYTDMAKRNEKEMDRRAQTLLLHPYHWSPVVYTKK